MHQRSYFRYLLFYILCLITYYSNGQGTIYLVKSGTESGIFSGGNFIGNGAKLICQGTPYLVDNTDVTTSLVWNDVTGFEEANDTLVKTDTTAWGNAGAVSNNQLKKLANGWIDYRIDDLYSVLEFGFTSNDTAGFDSIPFAFHIDSGQVYVYNSGIVIDTIGSVSVGDSLRLERLGDVLFYTKNGRIYHNQQVNAKDSLRLEVAVYTSGSHFTTHCTFGLESLVINTTGIDTLDAPDTLKYLISGVDGVSGIHVANSNIEFQPVGIASGTKTITTKFYGFGGSDSTKVLFDVDKYRQITNVRFKFNDTINQLDSSLFVVNRGVLALQDGSRNSYDNELSPFVNLLLDGGISLSPNDDGNYDTLLVESNIPVKSYYINVTSIAGDTVYESTNIKYGWNGKTAGGNLVEIGNYFYHIKLNGKLTEGQFLVEY